MSTTSGGAPGWLRQRTAEEIRVLLARKRMSAAELARRTGIKQSTMARRMTGEIAFDLDDLEAIARVLEVEVVELLPSTVRVGERGQPNDRWADIGRTDDPEVGQHVAPRPFSPPRRDSSRPVSDIPASRRRPSPVRPLGLRPMSA